MVLVVEPPSQPRRVACVGASVTFGRGLADRRRDCYPAVLQRLLDTHAPAVAWSVRNFGYSGATASRDGNEPYRRTPSFTAATRFAPHTTLVMLGTNDAQFANAASRASLGGDLADLVEHFRAAAPDGRGVVLLADPPPAFPPVAEIDFDALQEVVRPAIRRVSEAVEAPLVDFYTPLLDAAGEFPDGLHPTAAVAARIAQIAFEAVLRHL